MMMRGIRQYLPILCLSSALSPASAQLLDRTDLKVPVTNGNSAAGTIAAGNANGQLPLVADPFAAGGDIFDVVTDNAAAVVSLVIPGGSEVTSVNAANFGYTFATYINASNLNTLIPGRFDLAGTHTLIVLPASQTAGTYTVKVNAAAAVTPVLVIASFLTNSPVRSGATTNGGTFKVGDSVVITGLVFNGSTAITDATVTARIVNTANLTATPAEVPLVDSGIGSDFTTGDGLYTGTYTAATAGKFLAVVRTTGTALGVSYVRTATAAFTVNQPMASFTSFSDAGVDDNANSKPDRVVVTALVNVVQPGTYKFGIALQASNGFVLKGNTTAVLAAGSHPVPVSFGALNIINTLAVNGPYTMRDAALVSLDGVTDPMVDYVDNAGSTSAYSLGTLDRGSLYFAGQNTVTGIDNNSDNKFDTLRVQAAVVVPSAGFYNWSGRLVNAAGTEIGFFDGSGSLTSGSNNINFDFNGATIGQSCSTGVYSVRSVLLYGPGGSIVLDHLLDTQSFTPAQFAKTACFLVSATPNSGSVVQGFSQPFTFTYTNGSGSSNLASVSMLINSSAALGGSCSITWVRADHTVRLADDAGDGGYTYGQDSGGLYNFGNKQCTIAYNSPIAEGGNNLTMSFSLTFPSSFAGSKYIYMQATDTGGADTGLQLQGSVNITQGSPCDINADTNTNVADVQLIINEALGVIPAVHDLNHDGSVNVADVQKVINAALGLGCVTQ